MEEILDAMSVKTMTMIDTIRDAGAYGDTVVRKAISVSLKNQVVIMATLKMLLERTEK